MCVCTFVLTWSMEEKVVYLLPYLLEAGSLMEPGTRLAASKLSDLPCPLLPHGLGIWTQFPLFVQQVLCCVWEGLVVGVLKSFLGTNVLTARLGKSKTSHPKDSESHNFFGVSFFFSLSALFLLSLLFQLLFRLFCYFLGYDSCHLATFGDASILPLLLSVTSLAVPSVFNFFVFLLLYICGGEEKMYMCAWRWLS